MTIRFLLAALAALLLALPARAEFDGAIEAQLRPGWRLPNGDHIAALHMKLAPGWKTYWRAPGDAGIPPAFDWQGSRNVDRVAVIFPTPHVFYQSGMRSVGYKNELLLPLRIATEDGAAEIRLKGVVEIGVCKDVCLPHTIRFDMALPGSGARPDPMIAAAMADVPFTADEAAVRAVRCIVSPTPDGLRLRAEIDMPGTGGREEVVVEAGDPMIWVAEPSTRRSGGTLVAEADMMHLSQTAFALDRSRLRITVLGAKTAVDIQGCR
ncbi:protein-disulfide reductase DsbD domain-containing protein [Aestuariicoccus sp. MJ-SS9]|uniref:protein-disulfide reductase DsbD domain-containing protein n=1 Tax=Aestuariicoccus sp. MJ-SS9 TaxID=3079855 RepID=UPI00290B8BA4|nr:protein-disulfide reductase DsbD domain-containing protein [Aestuariicoccus sp. MJ-SS9]MDU8911746.1 protein-disulfide reductase DsbD family protein [Aestuariicoccus sp. MJ-SS9]